jgi:hypothetical protein
MVVFILCVVISTLIGIKQHDEGFAFFVALFFGPLSSRPIANGNVVDTTTHHSMRTLHFSSEGVFKISILEDLHFGEGQHTPSTPWSLC